MRKRSLRPSSGDINSRGFPIGIPNEANFRIHRQSCSIGSASAGDSSFMCRSSRSGSAYREKVRPSVPTIRQKTSWSYILRPWTAPSSSQSV